MCVSVLPLGLAGIAFCWRVLALSHLKNGQNMCHVMVHAWCVLDGTCIMVSIGSNNHNLLHWIDLLLRATRNL